MKCSKCKTLLRRGTKFCPGCGTKVKHTARKITLVLLSALIILSGAVIAGWRMGLFSEEGMRPSHSENENNISGGVTILYGSFSDRKIMDQTSALAAIGDAADILGIGDVNKEFFECREDTAFGNTYYRFYQEYEGIPVYGRSIVLSADENGDGLLLSGNYMAVRGVDTSAEASQEDVVKAIRSYFSEKLGVSMIEDLFVEEISTEKLCIYNTEDQSDLAYKLKAVCPQIGCYEVVVDVEELEVEYAKSLIHYDYEYDENGQMEKIKADGQRTEQTFDVYAKNGMYYMADTGRGIELYQLANSTSGFWWWKKAESTGEVLEVAWDKSNQPDEYAAEIDAIAHVQTVYDYYLQELGHRSTDGKGNAIIYLYTNTAILNERDWTDNAGAGSNIEKNLSVILVGQEKDNQYALSADLEVMAHEYTHAVIDFLCNLGDQDESSAINEGCADVIGEIIEAWVTGSCDWVHGNRTIYDPSVNGYAKTVSDEGNGKEDYSHGHSTVISHAAYLMWKGDDQGVYMPLTTQNIAQLFYTTFYSLPSDCTFQQFRALLENAADIMYKQGALTKEQKSCVSYAMEQVGIAPVQTICYTVSENLSLSVYDINGEKYDNYAVTATTVDVVQGPDVSSPIKEIKTTYEANQTLELVKGKTYQLVITDQTNAQNNVTCFIKVTSSGASELSLFTDFGELEKAPIESTDGNPSDASSSAATDAYIEVVENSMYKSGYVSLDEQSQQECRGILYDLNNDGMDELILRYISGYTHVFGVWTVENGEAICAFDNSNMWGWNNQSLYIIEDSSGNELVYTDSYWGTDANGGSWYFYSAEGNPYRLVHELSYAYWEEDAGTLKEGYRLDGREITDSEADSMLDEVRNGREVLQIGTPEEGLLLPDLLRLLREENGYGSDETGRTGYADVIKRAIERRNEACGFGGEGIFYDMDGNGIEELILMYEMNIDNGYGGFPYMVCDVYTIQDGEIIALLDAFSLYPDAGGPSGRAGIVSVDGQSFLAVTWESGETDGVPGGTMSRGGEWYLYSINVSTAELHTKVEYGYVIYYDENGNSWMRYDLSSASFNEASTGYEYYESWVDSLEWDKSVDGMVYTDEWLVSKYPDLVDDGIRLEDLFLMYCV